MNDKTPQSWLSRLTTAVSKKARPASLVAATALVAATLPGCLDRPIGDDRPRTTNILIDLLNQSVVDKIDLLFVIDNSMSMADKQAIMAEAVPDLLSRLVTPVCIGEGGNQVQRAGNDCPPGTSPEFNAIDDINIGIITTSLGGYGTDQCSEDAARAYTQQRVDMAHLVGSLPRAGAAGDGFLQWREGQDRGTLETNFENQVILAGEHGCGFEAPLEAWVRFLVDPYPYTKIVKRPCPGSTQECIGPELNADGTSQQIDDVILTQRRAFMRMDSLLAVIMLTDENDCSFKPSGQSWILMEGSGAPKASSQCATDPNDACCQPCGSAVNANCQADPDGLPLGCDGETNYPPAPNDLTAPHDDQLNVRCYRQKERFGIDFLYPVERYSNALTKQTICPLADDLDPASSRCANGGVVNNPVFIRDDQVRSDSLVFMGGIVGVPWQDLAQDPTADVLKYRKAVQEDNDPTGQTLINWDWLLGQADADGKRAKYPNSDGVIDPLMVEAIDPRAGTNPAIQAELAGPGAGSPNANPINGHEWNILDRSDLQYACIFPRTPVTCPSYEEWSVLEQNATDMGVPNCDCTFYGSEAHSNPLCQDPNGGEYGLTQYHAKAYPSIRPLQALELFAKDNPTANAIVASICPKTLEPGADYGYSPAVATIIDRLKEQLQEPCLPRPLGTKDDGSAACILIEATRAEDGCTGEFRKPVTEEKLAENVYDELEAQDWCGGNGAPCSAYKLCEIPQVTPDQPQYGACISGGGGDQGDGWCYVDADKVPMGVSQEAVDELLSKCPETQQRKLRFVGEGQPSSNALTFYACSGALFDIE